MAAQLLCPVRDCHAPLVRAQRTCHCEHKHSFDIARSGYLNLLQPQERRSKSPGDTSDAVAARRRLHDRGLTTPILQSIGEILNLSPGDSLLDAGCGDGYYLGSLARQSPIDAHGIDISLPAIEAAARRYPTCQWIVGNADRFVPYAGHSFSHLMSITARMNPAEFHRVLKSDGTLLIALPAPDDLIELRGVGKDRIERTLSDFAPHFALLQQRRATTTAHLEADAVQDVLHAIYRPIRQSPALPTTVTFSLDLLLLRPV